jgi:hypothetical protein
MKIETTEFERSCDEGFYISSNAPASGEFVKIEDYKKLEAENKALLDKKNTVIDTAASTAVAMMNLTDDPTLREMAANIADTLIALTDVPDL